MNTDQFTKNGKYLMLALDHRGSFKKLMKPENPDDVTDQQVVNLKTEIINSLMDQFSGLLVDEHFGLQAYPNHKKPFLLPVEKSGYTDQAGERITELEYKISDLVNLGASGAKLLLYYNPYIESHIIQQGVAKQVIAQAEKANFPVFMELVTYTPDGKDYTQDPKFVLDSVNSFLDKGITPDVFKLEFPGNLEGCEQISRTLKDIPWILLTNPDSFDEFVEHIKTAAQAGCKGFLAGRALWKEVCSLQGDEKLHFLKVTLPDRFRKIAEIAISS